MVARLPGVVRAAVEMQNRFGRTLLIDLCRLTVRNLDLVVACNLKSLLQQQDC